MPKTKKQGVYLSRNFRKQTAIEMRRKGYSYSEIQNSISVPKATLSLWFKDLELSEEHAQKLKRRQLDALSKGSQKRLSDIQWEINRVSERAARDIGKISKRELWLIGIMLYWKYGNENDLKKGVHFTSANPVMIKLFLKWLYDIGDITGSEIDFDIFTSEKGEEQINDLIKFWADITEFPRSKFGHIYFQKASTASPGAGGKNKRNRVSKKAEFGILRIRVKASSMLARQIYGWIKGISRNLEIDPIAL